MGILEKTNAERIRRDSIKAVIITTLAVAGAVALGGGARIAQGILKSLINPKKRYRETAVRVAVFRLQKEGMVYFEETARGKILRLSTKGEKYFDHLKVKNNLGRKHKWYRKWRVIIFDIKEHKRNVRDKFRQLIRNFGFYRLQDSVWVYPYDCEDFLILAKAELKIGYEILYMIVDMIEGDQKLKGYFKLSD